MDPLTLGLMAGGAALKIFGGMQQSNIAHQQASVSMDEAHQEQNINAQKQQQMQLQANRSQLENFRNVQRARAQGLNAAVNQGANLGSGLQGGQAQAEDQGLYNSLGINQNLQIGNTIAGYNQNISQDKIQMASLGGDAASAAGLSSLGGALMSAGPTIGNLSKGFSFSNIGADATGGKGGY